LVVAAKPTCLFFTGIGQKGPNDNLKGAKNLVARATFTEGSHPRFYTTMPSGGFDYWQGIPKVLTDHANVADYCDPYFYWTETIVRGWDSNLPNEFCLAISTLQAVKNEPIIVFTHSMGNMVLAAALGNKDPACANLKWQTDFSKLAAPYNAAWIGLQGPLQGSVAENTAESLCNPQNQNKGKGLWDKIVAGVRDDISKLASHLKECKAGYSTLQPSYVSPVSNAQLFCTAKSKAGCITLKSVAAQYMVGNECGTATQVKLDEFGTQFIDAFGLWTVHHIVNWGHDKAQCDGFVDFTSCSIPSKVYTTDSTKQWFISTDNHSQGRCYQKDKLEVDQSCDYMTNMLKVLAPGGQEQAEEPETDDDAQDASQQVDPKQDVDGSQVKDDTTKNMLFKMKKTQLRKSHH